MTARELEAALLLRCVTVAREAATVAQDQCEANVFRLAAAIIRSQFPQQATNLMQASTRYFSVHPNEQLPSAEVVRNGWVSGLPRLRDALSQQLQRE